MSDTQTCPESISTLFSTSVVRSRAGGPSYVVVTMDPRVTRVSYKVYPTVKDGAPVDGFCSSGELFDKFRTDGFSFVFPVQKPLFYFIVLTVDVESGWNHRDLTVTWLMDPFKRRVVTREDVAPLAPDAAVPPV